MRFIKSFFTVVILLAFSLSVYAQDPLGGRDLSTIKVDALSENQITALQQKLKQSDELKQQNINRSLQQSQIRLSMLGIILGIVNFNMLTELLIVILFLIGIGLSVFAPLKKIIKQA